MDQNPPKDVRSPVNLRIKFRSESLDQFIERYAVDVSRGGIFIRTREPLAVGTQLKLDFQYQNGGPLMAGDGTVVWIRDPDPARPNIPPGMGVRFDRLTPESQSVLEMLLADKAKREKSGLTAIVNPMAGSAGMAVRRPSSMFAALEPQGAGPNAPRGPLPFTSQLPVTGAPLSTAPPPKYGPVTSILIVPAEVKALGSVSAPSAAAPLRPGNVHVAETPATGILAALHPEAAPPGYRPLGTTKNPFSSDSGLQKLASAPPAARLTSTISTTGKSVGGSGRIGSREPLPDSSRHEAAPEDDINEEPTQIAGRVPSFLMTDDDPTSVGNRPTASDEVRQGAALIAETNRLTGRGPATRAEVPPPAQAVTTEMSAPPVPGPTPPRPGASPERFTGPLQDLASDLSARQKQSLDLAPPVGDQDPQLPAKAPDRTTDALLDPEAGAPPVSAKVSISRSTRGLDALSLAAAATDVRAQAPRKRSGALVALLVIVLGGGGVFAFKYFSAHRATPVVEPAAPSVVAVAPEPAAVAPAAEPTAAPTAAAPAAQEPAAPAAVKTEPAAPAAAKTEPAAAAAAPEAPPAPEKEPEPAAAAAPAKAVAEPAGGAAKKGGKRKPGHPGREAEAAGTKAAAEVPDTLPPAGAKAPAEKAAEKPVAADPGAGHQLRVTSKPSGADVSLDGQVIGQTPLATGISDVSAPHFVSVHKDGYEPFEQMISASSAWTKGKAAKGQPAVPTLKLNAKLKSTAPVADAKPAPAGDPAAAKEAPKEAAPAAAVAAAPAKAKEAPAAAPAAPAKAEEPKIDRPMPPSDDRLPPSTP